MLLATAAAFVHPVGAADRQPTAQATPASAPALSPPISVIDDAEVFGSDFETEMNQQLADLRDKSEIHVVLVSIGDLKGGEITDLGEEMLEKWGREHPEDRFSVLLVLAPNEREFALTKLIAPGAALPGETPEDVERMARDAQQILTRLEAMIASAVVPPFQRGDFEGGMRAAVDIIVKEIESSPFVTQRANRSRFI